MTTSTNDRQLADGRGAAPQFSFGPAAFKSGSAVGLTSSATLQR